MAGQVPSAMIVMVIVLLVLLISSSAPMVAAQPWDICGTTGNYTATSSYSANLDALSAALPENASASSSGLFAKGSVGAATDAVHGLALCRGDLNASACRACVATAFQGARRLCALVKDATVFYNTCLHRYSDQDFLELLDYSSHSYSNSSVDRPLMATDSPLIGKNSYSSKPFIAKQVMVVLDTTTQLVLAGRTLTRRFTATGLLGDIDGSNTIPPLYAYMQCTTDLTDDLCSHCLQNYSGLALANIGRRAGRVLGLRCNLRYEDYQSYSDDFTWITADGTTNCSVPLPPSPAPNPATVPPP